jgi:hypothetical protein
MSHQLSPVPCLRSIIHKTKQITCFVNRWGGVEGIALAYFAAKLGRFKNEPNQVPFISACYSAGSELCGCRNCLYNVTLCTWRQTGNKSPKTEWNLSPACGSREFTMSAQRTFFCGRGKLRVSVSEEILRAIHSSDWLPR